MGTVRIENLQPETLLAGDLMLDKSFLLLPANVPVYKELPGILKTWQFTELQASDDAIPAKKTAKKEENQTTGQQKQGRALQTLKKRLEEAKSAKWLNTETSRMDSVQTVYSEYMNYINAVYTFYATHKKIDYDELSDAVKELCVFIKDNKRYVLRVTPSAKNRSKNFLVIHSMRSTVLAITIGLELHLALSKLIELGVTCILHEIGMLRLPPQLYMTDRMLSTTEKARIMTHPLLGFNILKDLNFPLSVQLGVLEHHEKENGYGYPRHLAGTKISTYAKIIAVACSFEAITAPREYKTERTTFDAMVELLKNPNAQYDATVIKALLYSLSLFPIGAYVYLQNGKVGIVSDVTPNDPKNPIVQLATETEADGSPRRIQTDNGTNKIVRVLSKEEQADVQKTVAQLESQQKAQKAPETAAPTEQKDSEGFSTVSVEDFM